MKVSIKKSLLILLASVVSGSVFATIWTYTNTQTGGNNKALGYPVPVPVESLLPVDGFRSYASLHARHQDLMLVSDKITGQVVGNTYNGRPIWAYIFSDSDSVNDEGFLAEGAVMQNGAIHAREWASPEVVTGIMERLAENEGDNGLYDYLLNNLNIVILPVMNVDGFLQTQRFYNTVRATTYANDPSDWPRDGRMRRKNMRQVDESLDTTNDTLGGIDLNRNNSPYWNTSTGSSSNSSALTYHGNSAGSEPEAQALYAAARLGPEDRLRFYIDSHSFSQLWYMSNTNNSRRNNIAAKLGSRMRQATSNSYYVSPDPAGSGIGTTEEYFAETYDIPSYTLEIEPGSNGSVQYGGFGVSHSGFILPESEIARVRNELADASIIAWYMQSGPAAVKAIQVRQSADNTVVFEGSWDAVSSTERVWNTAVNDGLASGVEYTIWVAYNKPMRWLDDEDNVSQLGTSYTPPEPTVLIEGLDSSNQGFAQELTGEATDWLTVPGGPGVGYLNYKADAFEITFTLDAAIDPQTANLLTLAFENRDMGVEFNDANPATVADYQTFWLRYESSNGAEADQGGVDRMVRLIDDGSPLYTDPNEVAAPPPPPPPPAPEPDNGGGGGTSHGVILILLLLYRIRQMR